MTEKEKKGLLINSFKKYFVLALEELSLVGTMSKQTECAQCLKQRNTAKC